MVVESTVLAISAPSDSFVRLQIPGKGFFTVHIPVKGNHDQIYLIVNRYTFLVNFYLFECAHIICNGLVT